MRLLTGRRGGWMAAAMIAAAAIGAPAMAQLGFSAAHDFIKAVRDGDGAKAKTQMDAPGSTIVNTRDGDSGETPLDIVIKRRDLAWTGFLLANHADADLRNAQGDTPLVIAAQIGYVEGAQLLLQVGAQPNFANGRGETPLIIAVQTRNLAMVRLLISAGADPKLADHVAGQSAYDYARNDPRGAAVVRVLDDAKPRPAAKSIGPSQ